MTTREQETLSLQGGISSEYKETFSSSGDRQAVEQLTQKGSGCPVFEEFVAWLSKALSSLMLPDL